MTVNMNVTLLSDASILPTAPLIEGSVCAQLFNESPPRGDFGSSLIGRYGIRITLPATISFAGSDYISFYYGPNQYSPGSQLDTVANGGVRVIFIDSAGAYAGYNLYGQISGYDAAGGSNGWLASYSPINTTFNIAKGRTPDISSGTINWASIVAVECTVKTTAASRKDIRLGKIARRSAPLVTGTETFKSLFAAAKAMAASVLDPLVVSYAPLYLGGAAQTAEGLRLGLTVGNGSTTTTFTESKFALGFENSFEFFPAASTIGPWTQLPDDRKRELLFNQSATDTLSLTDGSIASAGWWQWVLQGSGVATCARIQFWRFNGFKAAHGAYTDCVWSDADSAVEVTAATVIIRGIIRGAKATGLKVLGAAGVYSNLDLSIDSLVGAYDIELGAGGAGTYELPNITVPAGRTLRVRNNSASNAIVVVLPPGTLYSATTAGGSITVVSAGTKLTITDLPPGCDAVVLTAGTSTVLAQADELPDATFVFEYTGAPVVDIGIFKPGYKPRYLRNLQLATSDSAIPVSLEIDRSYLP